MKVGQQAANNRWLTVAYMEKTFLLLVTHELVHVCCQY